MSDENDGQKAQPNEAPVPAEQAADKADSAKTSRSRRPIPFLVRERPEILIGTLGVALVAVIGVGAAAWVHNNQTIEELTKPRPTVKLGVPLANPTDTKSTTTTTTTTKRSVTRTTLTSKAPETTATSETTTSSSESTSASESTTASTPTSSVTATMPTTTSAPRPADANEQSQLEKTARAFYMALAMKDLQFLNAYSCTKITAEDIAWVSDDTQINVDKFGPATVDGERASSNVTVTFKAGGKSTTKEGVGHFLKTADHWVVCDNS